MNSMCFSPAFAACYDNDLDAFIPEIWANEALQILQENMVMTNLVHRDFSTDIAKFGDVVHTQKPGDFRIRRKNDGVTLVPQDATATDVQVPLDQWFCETFVIRDGEGSKSFQDLVTTYLEPAIKTISRGLDRALLGRVHAYMATNAARVGKLGGLSSSTAKDYVLDAREKLNVAKAPMDGRRLVMAPSAETSMLKTDLFLKANERGDGGTALENAVLGRILGFDTYMDQNVNCVLTGADIEAGTFETDGAEAVGATVIETADIADKIVNGQFVTIEGDMQPSYVASHVDATSITLHEGLKYAVLADADITIYKSCQAAATYAAGYSRGITLKSYTTGKAPQIGQLLAFDADGSHRQTFTVIESEDAGATCVVYLDRPLVYAVTENDAAFPGPYGSMNLAFHKNALALVTRPLAVPDQRTGVLSAVVSDNGVGIRVSMQYSLLSGGMIVNCDVLAGVAVLESGLLVPVLG